MADGRRLKRAAMAALAVAASTALSGCGSMSGGSSGSPSTSSSIGSKFSQLFGSNSQEASTSSSPSTQATQNSDLTCPSVAIRFGASTLAVGVPGKPASGNDLRYQGSITRTARDCNLQNGQVTVRIGILGRIITGPAGAPPTVDVPMRVAVVQEGAPEKVIVTKAFRTTVAMEGENTEFSIVAEDIVYPAPTEAANDKYIFYVGFDPAALKPEPARKRKK
ncbi:hypothetical protein YH63_005545 [Afipia massiliensis]|uniref:Lipoprotein n=1 Tax=Afipia massiliensis TaxID=211460 RepID=A0A4U6BL17_9BRAD|nr:hypothetical protein [Afipia massiliensis]TKT70912.1 hypothetical protein YH63_005545 [Afipia massiliensis]